MEVAGRQVLGRNSSESTESRRMILSRDRYHADIGAYDVADVDDGKRYRYPEAAVTVLDMLDNLESYLEVKSCMPCTQIPLHFILRLLHKHQAWSDWDGTYRHGAVPRRC